MALEICTICEDRREITRPTEVVLGKTIRHWYDGDGRIREAEVPTKTLAGGTDACPVCTMRSETEWKMGKIERLRGELDQLENQLDMAEHNDTIGMAATISRLYREVGEKRGEVMLAEEEAAAEEMDNGQFGVGG